jgi:hypothetical protein
MLHTSNNNDGDFFATVWYRMSCALLPGILTLYYQQQQQQTIINTNDDSESSSSSSSIRTCLPPSIMAAAVTMGLDLDDGDEKENSILQISQQAQQQQHGFPVVVIFHFITSLALYFMKYQWKQNQTSINKILKLKQELLVLTNNNSVVVGSSSSSSESNAKNNNKKNKEE